MGGSYPWGPKLILGLATLGAAIAVIHCWLTRERVGWAFLPAVVWTVFCVIAALNANYVTTASGWLPKSHWIQWLPTTVDARRTFNASIPILGVLLEAAAVARVFRRRFSVRILWSIIALNGFVLAAVGAFFRFSGAEQALGFIDVPEANYFFATFFYKNHWAAYGTLASATAIALVIADWPAVLAGDPRARGRAMLFGAAGLLTLITLPLPGSRSGAILGIGLILFSTALLAQLSFRISRRSPNVNWLLLGTVVAAGGVIGFGFSAYEPSAKVDLARTRTEIQRSADGANIRLMLSRDTWHMARARPWFGWGPGSFEVVFPLFEGAYLRDAAGRPQGRVQDAHDDWLQLLAECGVLGSAIVLVPLIIVATAGFGAASTAGRWVYAICAIIALYAGADFPFRNPAVLVLWVILLATARRI